ncbi:MAG: hypothetical protein CMJ39_03335 [Phycisphaerae bacterium]|nr:hypothetical protein [Phycisphaerae bacterium]
MALIAVSISVEEPALVAEVLELAQLAGDRGASLVEWRVDELGLSEAGHEACQVLVRESPLPCILTCRHECEGGAFDGNESQRASLFDSLIETNAIPRYVDIESARWAGSPELRESVRRLLTTGDCGLILSTHDFEGRPDDLARRVDSMRAEPEVNVVKVAWSARSIRDSMEAFDLLRESAGPTITICMDRFGVITRILAGKFGGLLTFAVLDGQSGTAPGQPTLTELQERYRFGDIGAATKVYGILGDPVAHSLSPLIHNAAFRRVDHDAVLVPMPVVDGWESFKASVATMLDQPSLDLAGLCVTAPHKENLLRFVQEQGGTIADSAMSAGAANTLVIQSDGGLVADNTDVHGIISPLQDVISLEGVRVAILGAGGAARAAASGLLAAGAEVVIFNRTRERAEHLVSAMKAEDAGSRIEVGSGGPLATDRFQVIINTTSLGMEGGPDASASPLEALGGEHESLAEGVILFETVYAPRETPLVQEAIQRGAVVITGDRMFLAQAAQQFKRWTGHDAPMEQWQNLLG